MPDTPIRDANRPENRMNFPNEHWRLLCKRAATETDRDKLLNLVREILKYSEQWLSKSGVNKLGEGSICR